MRFWGLFLFSFLFPPVPNIFSPKLGSECRLSPYGLSPIPRTVVSSGETCPDQVERTCGHITQWACLWDVERGIEAEFHLFVVGIEY
ncbi:mCG1034285 [Mus musculus]|nr:mCG1034285 [Mus musculus]